MFYKMVGVTPPAQVVGLRHGCQKAPEKPASPKPFKGVSMEFESHPAETVAQVNQGKKVKVLLDALLGVFK